MPLSREQSQIWDAMGIGPQWILRSAEDPLLPKKPAAQPALATAAAIPGSTRISIGAAAASPNRED